MKKALKNKSVLLKTIYIFKTDSFHKITSEDENNMPTEHDNPLTKLDPYNTPFCIANTRSKVIKILTELIAYQVKVIDQQSITIREQELQITNKIN